MAPRPKHAAATVAKPADARLRVAVIADTHSRPHPRAAELVRAQLPHVILHAGDIGERATLDAFVSIAPLHAVRGNIDERGCFPDSIDLSLGPIRALLTHIALAGTKLRADARRLAERHVASLVVCGHSHIPFVGQSGPLSVFNPGSIGPRRFSLPITFGMLEIDDDERVRAYHVSCETGARWTP